MDENINEENYLSNNFDLNDLFENNPNNETNLNRTSNQYLPTSNLEEFQRETNQEILNLFRRVLSLREGSSTNVRNEIIDFEEYFYQFIISNKLFLYTIFILIPLVGFLIYQLNNIFNKGEYTIKILESHQMWISYAIGFIILILIMWNFYLLIFKIFSHFYDEIFSHVKLRELLELSSADVLYFNPFYFNMLVFHYNKIYLCTNFDLFCLMIIATHYFINYFFVNLTFNFYKIKIAKILNLHIFENKISIYKMRILFIFLIFMNLLSSHITQYITSEADFYFIYLMQHKSFYLIIKLAGLWYENETSYKQLDNIYATNEQYYLNSIFIKMIFQMISMILIIQILFFGNMLFLKRGTYVFLVPCFFIFIKTIYDIFKIFKNYEEVKNFFDKMETIFPQECLENRDIECSICTELLTKARRLTCNHHFHLICLSKWIEKGKKNCPLCRKEITENVESFNRNNRQDYVFRFSLGNRFFSWLPDITVRLGRVSFENDNRRNSENIYNK